MKRILFLLLLTVSVYGQNPSRFAKIQITANSNSGTATKVNVQEANGEVNTQAINTGFNKNFGLNTGDVVGATTLLNQYSTTPVDWTATTFASGQVVFYGGKQWISNATTVAGDVPSVSSKWDEITFESLANKTITVDAIPTDGSNNAVSSNGVFDALATKAPISSVHNPVTIGTANGLSLANQVLSLGLASSGVTGALSGTDWNTFNNKQNALTNPVTGTGTTNRLTKFTGTSTIGGTFITESGADLSFSPNLTNPRFVINNENTFRVRLGVASGAGAFHPLSAINDAVLVAQTNLILAGNNGTTNGGIIIRDNGRILFNTTTDNLTDIAQFNGSAISTAWKTTGGTTTQYVTGTGSLVDFNTGVRTALLTGFTSGAGTVSATDNVLQAIQKLNGNDALKAPLANPTFTGTVNGITKTMVGLGNVDNTSDLNKPISTATQTALQNALTGKADVLDLNAHVSNIGNPHGVTKSQVGLANVDNTSDTNKPISTATQTALNAKANISGQVFTGAISATNLSGTNTGDNAVNSLYSGLVSNATHTGDVTGATALTITNGAVTNAKMANVATGTIKGRVTAATGVVEDLTATQVRTLLNVADGATANSPDATLLNRANHTGTQLASTISDLQNAITNNASVLANTAKVGNATHTGDATGSTVLTLATVNANVGSFGTASSVPTVTVNGKGLVTAAVNTPIAIAQSQVTNLTTDLGLKAPLASPTFTGTPTAPTATAGTNTTQVATTAFVTNAGAGDVRLTGDQSIYGTKKFIANTGFFGLMAENTAGGSTSFGATTQNGFPAIFAQGQGNTGDVVTINANALASGNLLNIDVGANPNLNFILGRKNSADVFKVDNNAVVTAASFIKSAAPTTNLLLAGGGDIAQSTFATANNPTFTGSVVVPTATLATQAVNKGQLDAVGGLKQFKAVVNQTGSNAPTFQSIRNTTGVTISMTYISVGVYQITAPSATWQNGFTFISVCNGTIVSNEVVRIKRLGTATIEVRTFVNNVATNDVLKECSLNIESY
jgi:hypothetical protein